MALTPEQEAYLAKLADAGLAQEIYTARVKELDAARIIAEAKVLPQFDLDIKTLTGDEQKQAIRALQSAIAADPEVTRLASEAKALLK